MIEFRLTIIQDGNKDEEVVERIDEVIDDIFDDFVDSLMQDEDVEYSTSVDYGVRSEEGEA